MKEFAGNVKKITPEGMPLPKGAEELLNLPTTIEANQGANKYLASKTFYNPDGSAIEGVGNARIQSFAPNKEGRVPVLYDTAAKKNLTAYLRLEDISANITKGTEAAVASTKAINVGQKADIATAAKTIQPAKKRAMTAGISYSPAMETIEDNVSRVISKSGAMRGLLGAATDASAAVAGGVSKTGALRNAGMAATILRKRFI
jgi:hypothetical protein